MNRGWGPDQRRGSNPWWAFGTLDLAQSTDTMHKSVTDLAQSNSSMHKSVSPHSVSFPNDYRRQSWSALLFCLSVREGGWRGISNRLPLSHITPIHTSLACTKRNRSFLLLTNQWNYCFFLQPHLSPFDIWYSAIRISLAFAQGPILGVVFVIKGNSAIKLEGFILWRSYCLILCIYEKERIYTSLKKAKFITYGHFLQHGKTTSYLPTA